jgi:Nuclease-related domain
MTGRMQGRSHSHGNAGASARREHDRRKARREEAVLRRHPRLGKLVLAVQDAPQPERRWAHGAGGEKLVAAALEKRCGPDVVALHDRRLPRTSANIDHLVVAPSGVWVVDAKRYAGKIRVERPLFGAAKLTIAGRDRTKLVEGLAKQVAAVQAAVAELASGPPVHGAFCFVEGELPLLGTQQIKGFELLHRRALAKRVNADGPLDAAAVAAIAAALADRFPPA